MEIKPEELLFAREAAEYLGITPQRLYQLVNDGMLVPFKRSSSGMIFLLQDLNRRKEELLGFRQVAPAKECGFKIDSPTKQEAFNFALMMKMTGLTEKPLYEQYRDVWESDQASLDLRDQHNFKLYADTFGVSMEDMAAELSQAIKAFFSLHADDQIIKIGEMGYPTLLSKTAEAPRFLYLRGNTNLLEQERCVSVVGSRKASERSKEISSKVAEILCRNGIVVVSGLARGIDVSAHVGTLEAKGHTIAVLGTPLTQYYPAENKPVQQRIEKEGLVVSQFSPIVKTERWFFPLRDGVMSGLSLATVVIEAGETSGALKQAEYALKQGRQVLIPSSALRIPTITWPAKFIQKGAKEVHSVREILEILAKEDIYRS